MVSLHYAFLDIADQFFLTDEIKRERDFYRSRGLPCPKDIPPNAADNEDDKMLGDQIAEVDYHRMDEQVCINHSHSFEEELYTLPHKILRRKRKFSLAH